jgi:hypothetical protein
MAGPRTTATAGASPALASALAPEHRAAVSVPFDGGGIVRGVFARRGDLAQHRAGLERARGEVTVSRV